MILLAAQALACNAPAPPNVTEFEERYFRIVLPGQWYEGRIDTFEFVWRYSCCGGDELLGVTFLPASHELDDRELLSLMDRYLSRRIEGEKDFGIPGVELSAPEIDSAKGAITATYTGEDGAGNRFASKIVTYRFGIVSFYYSATGLPEEQFAARRKLIFAKAAVID